MPLIRLSSDTVTTRLTRSRMYCHVRVSASTLPPRPSAIVGFTSIVTQTPCGTGGRKRVRRRRFDADDVCARLHRRYCRRDPADEAAAADGHDHDVQRRPLLDDLHADGSSPRNHVVMVVRRDEHGAVVRRPLQREGFGLLVVVGNRPQVGARALDGLELRARRIARREDCRTQLREIGGPGHRQPMIPR